MATVSGWHHRKFAESLSSIKMRLKSHPGNRRRLVQCSALLGRVFFNLIFLTSLISDWTSTMSAATVCESAQHPWLEKQMKSAVPPRRDARNNYKRNVDLGTNVSVWLSSEWFYFEVGLPHVSCVFRHGSREQLLLLWAWKVFPTVYTWAIFWNKVLDMTYTWNIRH